MDTNIKRLSVGGMLIALDIIFGYIGTSPLYVFQTPLEECGRKIHLTCVPEPN
jgi:K+ transporter